MLMLEDKQKFEGLDHVLEAINNHRMATLSRDSTNMQLPTTFQPGKCDVLCCGGKEGSVHIGNKRYRVIIENNVTAYRYAKSKYQKSFLVSKIVASVKEASGNEFGGFVKKDPLTGRWYQVEDKIAREKVSHALRDAIKVQKRKEARQSRMNDRLDTRVSSNKRARKQFDGLNPHLSLQDVLFPNSSNHYDGCHQESAGGKLTCDDVKDTDYLPAGEWWTIGGCGTNDWEKSLKESTKHFLQSPEEGDLSIWAL